MKWLGWLLAFGFIIASSTSVEGATSQKKKVAKSSAQVGKKKSTNSAKVDRKKAHTDNLNLQTDVTFGDSYLHGQYQTPLEALAKVENEKGLSDLLGVRKHFKDRLLEASEQE